ncbi:alpha/beta hydrolase [Bradyrhizobium arachidis]|uniref:Alpha/beta hydrolase n=2 Tax=Bradyrhizobium arachidis TaxID=858423 RepID=A0AAE7NL32_9BRAD|nr:alpha/beta hydrolase [Bradyrhizobium arachidis]QOZ67347.1 alpha/beta hydrolase [Bradyrhizobium arachidis]SFU80369.1 Lysophospholipase, alpha-beta hydrolase superfamily [Bradyrhizobium arachidis]
MKRLLLSSLLLSISAAWLPAWSKEPRQLVAQDFHVASTTPGVQIFLRNKRPKDLENFDASRTVLYVHGSTQPSETVFDLAVGHGSWADYIASQGYDVWLVDVRGYGGSRPPADQSKPFATTKEAVEDLTAAVDHILAQRKLSKLQLIGWSWGTLITGSYAAAKPQHVAGLVLLAPPWLSSAGGKIPEAAWQEWTADAALKRLQTGVPEGQAETIFPPAWKTIWEQALLATQPDAKAHNPPRFRSPTGVVADGAEYWNANKAIYDPGKISAPTLIIRGEWDELTPLSQSQALFALLRNAPVRHLIEIPRATHFVEVETGRDLLFREVQNFLDRN